ncbi:TPM domain-containing protein, partial [Solirubrobacter taibaiensis]|nr:TPM domain-containing protein [Solirubrobacter taibaiensis]
MLIKLKQKLKYVLTIIFAMLCFQHTTWAETATATDQGDLVVAGKMIQQQQQQNKSSTTTEQAPVLPTVANDMADGESIRGLPTLNQPVIDQAKVLSEAEIQQLNQKIQSLYQQG